MASGFVLKDITSKQIFILLTCQPPISYNSKIIIYIPKTFHI